MSSVEMNFRLPGGEETLTHSVTIVAADVPVSNVTADWKDGDPPKVRDDWRREWLFGTGPI